MIEASYALMEAEVLGAYPPTSEKNKSKQRWEYDLLYRNSLGFLSVVGNAVRLESFSGYSNFCEMVLEASSDYSSKESSYSPLSDLDQTFTKGARCVLAFLGGLPTAPIIIGMLPHQYNLPTIKSNYKITEGDGKDEISDSQVHPVLEACFNGMQFGIDEVGDFTIIHNGRTITTQENPFKAPKHKKPTQDRLSSLKFGYNGDLRYRNSASQSLELDPKIGLVSLKDKNSQLALVSEKDKDPWMMIRTAGKFFEHSVMDKQRTCDANETIKIKKDLLQEVDGKITINSKKEYLLSVKDKATIKSEKVIIDAKKIAIGSGSIELFDTLVKTMQKVIENAEMIVNTTAGPGQLNPIVKQTIEKAKSDLDSIKGSL